MTFWKVEKAELEEKDNEDVFGKMVVTGTKNMSVQTEFCFKYNIDNFKISSRCKLATMQYRGVTRNLQDVNLQPASNSSLNMYIPNS